MITELAMKDGEQDHDDISLIHKDAEISAIDLAKTRKLQHVALAASREALTRVKTQKEKADAEFEAAQKLVAEWEAEIARTSTVMVHSASYRMVKRTKVEQKLADEEV